MRQITVSVPTTVPASEIAEGECFRKKTGEYIYLRISESSARLFFEKPGSDEKTPLEDIYGVCLINGNLTKVSKKVPVWREEIGWLRRTNMEG